MQSPADARLSPLGQLHNCWRRLPQNLQTKFTLIVKRTPGVIDLGDRHFLVKNRALLVTELRKYNNRANRWQPGDSPLSDNQIAAILTANGLTTKVHLVKGAQSA